MKRLIWMACEIADRTMPLMALCGLLLSIGLLGSAADLQHRIWAIMAIALASVAMWAFWGGK